MFSISEASVTVIQGQCSYWLHRPPVPTGSLLLTFSSTRQASFYEAPYDIPARLFAEAGYAVASFDLPNHGEQINHFGQGIDGFCAAVCARVDPFQQFIAQGQAVIDLCLAQGIGQGGIMACGVSRAGYCALRLAAADSRIRAVAGLAPVVDWRTLREFAAVRAEPAVATLALDHWAEQLAGRAVFLAIGNGDSRVSSASCARFGLRLLEREEAAGRAHSQLELHIVDSPGHSLADRWRSAGAEFLLNYCQPPTVAHLQ